MRSQFNVKSFLSNLYRLKGLYDYIITAVDDFLTNGIQTLQHWWKKCVMKINYIYIYIYIYIYMYIYYRPLGLVGRMFASDPGDWVSIPGRVTPKTRKRVINTSLLNTLHYKVCIKGKIEQSRKRSSVLPNTSV